MKILLPLSLSLATVFGGIHIPEDECRWISTTSWQTELKCDGNEVAVGSCSGGRNRDCPGGIAHQLKCCAVPEYYYSKCTTYGAGWVPIDCREHGDGIEIVEGQCHSGEHADCHGFGNQVTCCHGHYQGRDVGPTAECSWDYAVHGQVLECGRSDEVLVGRCGSGENKGN